MFFALTLPIAPDYRAATESWRTEYCQELLAPQGWLKLAGLIWLKPGENSLGSGSDNDVRLPVGTPGKVGTLTLTAGKVHFRGTSGESATIDGKPSSEADLVPDADGKPTLVQVGQVLFKIIKRGSRIGVRVFDPNSHAMKIFQGLHWYSVDPAMRISADFHPYPEPKKLMIANVLGDIEPVNSPGYVTFKVAGKECRLDAEAAGAGLFFNFHDLTSGKETYGAGRFLDADAPKEGVVILDFNRATNPPCGYTEFATCPLPPKANFLAVAIHAGEKKYHE